MKKDQVIEIDQKEALKEVIKFLKSKISPSFILLYQPVEGSTTSHLEEIKIKNGFEMIIAGLNHLINFYVESHPEFSPEDKQILTGIVKDVQLVLNNAAKRFNPAQRDGKNTPVA